MIEVGILKNFDSGIYKAIVQLAGSITTYFDDISVAKNIPSSSMIVGNYVILAIPGGNPKDACVIATWPSGSSGGSSIDELNDIGDVNVPSPSDDDVLYWDQAAGKWQAKAPSSGGAGTFLELSDTPSSYSGQSFKPVRVNSGASAIEFASAQLFVPLATPSSIYRHWSSPVSSTPRTATVSGVLGDVITLTANEAYRFWSRPSEPDNPAGNVYLKIANTSKSPVQYAWVKSSPEHNQLQVTDSCDISGWSNGNTISTAEDGVTSKDQELDLSPLIPEGAKGIMVKLQVQDSGTLSTLKGTALSAQGVSGTLVWCFMQATDVMNVAYPSSPIQSNRHVFVRDKATGTDSLKIFIVVLGYFI